MSEEHRDADRGVVRVETTDVDEHAAFWRRAGAENRIDQLDGGRFRGAIAAALSGDGTVAAATVDYNRLVRVRGAVEPDRLGLVLDHAGHGRLPTRDGRSLGPDEAMAFVGGAEVDVAWDAAPFGTLSLDLGLLRGTADRITGEPRPFGFRACRELRAAGRREAEALGRLRDALREVEQGATRPWGAAATTQLVEDVFLFLSAADAAAPGRRERASRRRLRRAEEFLRACADRPVALAELCGALGVPERTLRADFRERFGMGPIAYLRRLRLNGARRALARGEARTVTEAATGWGFYQLGEFAGAYKAHFGERPSDTLRRGRSSDTKAR